MSKFRKHLTFEIQARHQNVSGSCLLCSIYFPDGEKFRFAVDAGIFQEEELNFLNHISDFKVSKLEHIFVTHCHLDHVGALPLFTKRGFNGNIYMTPRTHELLPISLFDSAKIFAKESEVKHTNILYSDRDVVASLKRVVDCEFGKTYDIDKNVKVTFFENGHLCGAAFILFQITFKDESLNILFTGDYNTKNYFFTPKRLPNWVKKLDNLVIVQESTYGTTNSYEIRKTFCVEFPKIIEENKSILIPSLALERYEVILATLKKLQLSGKLPIEIPIYIDGPLAQQYLKKYQKFYGDSFLPEDLYTVLPGERETIVNDSSQKIILTTSGMCTNGPAPEYLKRVIGRSNWAVFFTSFLSDDSVARKVVNSYKSLHSKSKKDEEIVKKIVLWDEEFDFNASVYQTHEFSSHAKSDQLIKFLRQFENILAILVNHGEYETKIEYSNKLKELGFNNIAVLSREIYFTLDKTGILSQNTTKFRMTDNRKNKLEKNHTFKKKGKHDQTCRRNRRKRINYRALKAQMKAEKRLFIHDNAS